MAFLSRGFAESTRFWRHKKNTFRIRHMHPMSLQRAGMQNVYFLTCLNVNCMHVAWWWPLAYYLPVDSIILREDLQLRIWHLQIVQPNIMLRITANNTHQRHLHNTYQIEKHAVYGISRNTQILRIDNIISTVHFIWAEQNTLTISTPKVALQKDTGWDMNHCEKKRERYV